jgi:hypothetical protein
MPSKPKNNRKDPVADRCGTPSYAVTPLLPYLPKDWVLWESASGEGLLVDALETNGYQVISGDILTGQNYFAYEPENYDCQVTNVPFSIKYDWLKRAYQLGKPFALLAPSDMLFAKTAITLFEQYGIEILIPRTRINFKMPNLGWSGRGAQMSTSWFTYGLNIGRMITFVDLVKPKRSNGNSSVSEPQVITQQLSMF